MGQRSQIYVRYNGELIVANYYQWNYGERMISRARWGIENLKYYVDHCKCELKFRNTIEKIRRIFDVNFDMHDVALSSNIIDEYEEWVQSYPNENFYEFIFINQHNNDGKLLVDIRDEVIKYALLDCECNVNHIMSASEYMDWDEKGYRTNGYMDADCLNTLDQNIEAINSMATLMSKDEVIAFMQLPKEDIEAMQSIEQADEHHEDDWPLF